ncbi:hypothetical protein GDO78_014589 [Eleutherodactylus coqui]|uniref:Testis expressed 264, ER-phagy receptor n=1 Tax=Eleutherodactylus coqui TaxID=57060 RepID=A0A8J6JX28_ELECQ|nr:hypothetical protein GDO78_014589 [Eleutherodactylus coqui]
MGSVPEWVLISLIAALIALLLLTLFGLAVYSGLLTEVEVPVEFCRYIVGSILSEGDEKPLPDHVRIFRKHGFKFCVLPEVNHAVMATFPYTTPFSIQLATTRVHPALEKYVKERKLCAHPYVEIYKGDKIIFMCPLSRQDDFYVPEMKELLRKERGEAPLPESEGAELDPLLLEDTLSLELVSENQEETETEGAQRKEQNDSEKSPSESGASASSFEELDLDGNAAAAKAQQDAKTEWSSMPESWDKERAEE